MSYVDSIVDRAIYLLHLSEDCADRGEIGNAYRYEVCLFEIMGQMTKEELEQYKSKVN